MTTQDIPDEVLKEVLIEKAEATKSLVVHFGNNKAFVKAEMYFQEVIKMLSQTEQSDIITKVLICKASTAGYLVYFLSLNYPEKAEKYFGMINQMSIESYSSEVINHVFIEKAKAAKNLIIQFGKNDNLVKAEAYYQILEWMILASTQTEILVFKVEAAYNLLVFWGKKIELFIEWEKDLEKATGYFKEIKRISLENNHPNVITEALMYRANAAKDLASFLANIHDFDRAAIFYDEFNQMIQERALNEDLYQQILLQKVEAAKSLVFSLGKDEDLNNACIYYEDIKAITQQEWNNDLKSIVIKLYVETTKILVSPLCANDEFEKAEEIYQNIKSLIFNELEIEVNTIVLFAEIASSLVADFGSENLEKAEIFYKDIQLMLSVELPEEIMNKIIILNVDAAYNIATDFGNNGNVDKAEEVYQQIHQILKLNLNTEVMKTVLKNKIKTGSFLYKIKDFGSWELAFDWLNKNIYADYTKFNSAEIARYVILSFIGFYRKFRLVIPNITKEQIEKQMLTLYYLYYKDQTWKSSLASIKNSFHELGMQG